LTLAARPNGIRFLESSYTGSELQNGAFSKTSFHRPALSVSLPNILSSATTEHSNEECKYIEI